MSRSLIPSGKDIGFLGSERSEWIDFHGRTCDAPRIRLVRACIGRFIGYSRDAGHHLLHRCPASSDDRSDLICLMIKFADRLSDRRENSDRADTLVNANGRLHDNDQRAIVIVMDKALPPAKGGKKR